MPAAVGVYLWSLGGRYGGRAESGMKKSFREGIVAIDVVPRAGRYRYPVKISGPADEDICSVAYLYG